MGTSVDKLEAASLWPYKCYSFLTLTLIYAKPLSRSRSLKTSMSWVEGGRGQQWFVNDSQHIEAGRQAGRRACGRTYEVQSP